MDESSDMTTGSLLDESENPSSAELEAAGQSAMFGDADTVAEPETTAPNAQPYRVLARKYRPQTFSELIGQDAMVQTLGNAIARDRLAHAFLMTGVRGVGKTSTARLIAKALNCVGPEGDGGPTIDPCGVCEPCQAIAEGRHIDVIEMDAASHTGVDDVREIIEAVRYAAVSARYKIYIIDEVHMLSRNAFNALLKTLEEPPAHVKFLFATTEVDKLPVTVLSRTQRFDLRRIPAGMLQNHFAWVCEQEKVEAESEALAMIAASAEGSVRDGLSILDQAIAHADLDEEGRVSAARVREMLGLADKGAGRRLFASVLAGEGAKILEGVEQQYALGVEPASLVKQLLQLVHRVTVAQFGDTSDISDETEREQVEEWAKALQAGQLHRLWQLLLKTHEETLAAPEPLIAAKMGLLRAMHAHDLPDPEGLLRKIKTLQASAPSDVDVGSRPVNEGPGDANAALTALIDELKATGAHHAANVMALQVRPIRVGENELVFSRDPKFRDDIVALLKDALASATGERWKVELKDTGGSPSLVEQKEAQATANRERAMAHPLVKATLAAFPNAELIEETSAASLPETADEYPHDTRRRNA